MKEWWSARELAAERLPGLPIQRANIRLFAERERWRCRETRNHVGGARREYHLSSLPEAARLELERRAMLPVQMALTAAGPTKILPSAHGAPEKPATGHSYLVKHADGDQFMAAGFGPIGAAAPGGYPQAAGANPPPQARRPESIAAATLQPRPTNRADGRDAPGAIAAPEIELRALWDRFERANFKAKERAEFAARAVMRAEQLRDAGMGWIEARKLAAAEFKVSRSALESWHYQVRAHARKDYAAALLPRWRAGGRETEIDVRLEELFGDEYKRKSQPARTVAFEHALRRRLLELLDGEGIPEIEIARAAAYVSRRAGDDSAGSADRHFGSRADRRLPLSLKESDQDDRAGSGGARNAGASGCFAITPALERAFARLGALPTPATLFRRLMRRDGMMALRYAREGLQALKRSYPAQHRERDHFYAGQAYNADGHKIDVQVLWPDWWPEQKRIARPMLLAVQDLFSGRILACRVAQAENWDTVRLAFSDAFLQWGLPRKIYLDNGRAFQAKWLTGGMRLRFRFKVRECDPIGIFTQMLGADAIHPTTPYWGQAKPIERAFGDWARNIARHKAFEGAYVGPNPTEKPDNAHTRVVPLDRFLEVLRIEIAAHNARGDRRGGSCRGRSFDQTFLESYDRARMEFPSDEQTRALLLTAEGVRVDRLESTLRIGAGRYWDGALADFSGERVVARFDLTLPGGPVFVYRLDGTFICEARALDPVRFDDVQAAGAHAKARSAWMKSHRVAVDATRKFVDGPIAAIAPPKREKTRASERVASAPQAGLSDAFARLEENLKRIPDREAV